MTYKSLVQILAVLATTLTIAACDLDEEGMPAIAFALPSGTDSIVTSDVLMSVSGTAQSEHPIDAVTWSNDRGGSGKALGGDNWQIANIFLSMGINNITVTALDTAGNSNSKSVSVTREAAGAPSNDGGGGSGAGANGAAPTIASFSASAAAITQGGSVTLSWAVNGAESVSIDPQPGQVQGSSAIVFPAGTTTYTLSAQNAFGTAQATVRVVVLSGANDWNVTERPPAITNPRIVNVSNLGTENVAGGGILCGGKIRHVRLGDSEDALVYMSGNTPLRYPVHITGGRNVRVVGLHIELVTQPGCGIGELPNNPVAEHPNASIHPRVPGAIALRLQQSRTSFVEGLHIDVYGHEADCIVSRNPDDLSNAQAQLQRDVIIQNTYCSGVEGLEDPVIGGGVHGDFFQNQGEDVMRRLVFENVSQRTSQEGIVLHGSTTESLSGTVSLVIRRFDYSWDPRFVGDDSYDWSFGLAFDGWPSPNWTLEDIRIDDYRDGGDYIKIRGQRYGNSPSSTVQPHPEIRSGLPPQGSFALPEQTGTNYVSPHGGVPTG